MVVREVLNSSCWDVYFLIFTFLRVHHMRDMLRIEDQFMTWNTICTCLLLFCWHSAWNKRNIHNFSYIVRGWLLSPMSIVKADVRCQNHNWNGKGHIHNIFTSYKCPCIDFISGNQKIRSSLVGPFNLGGVLNYYSNAVVARYQGSNPIWSLWYVSGINCTHR